MQKLTKIRSAMKSQGFAAILLTDELNCYYATGFSFTDGCVLITENSAHLLTDSRYKEEASMRADPSFLVVTPDSRASYVTEILDGERIKSLAYEDLSLSCASYAKMKELYPFTLVPMNSLLLSVREKKDADELALISRAQALTDRAFAHLLTVMKPEMSEVDIVLELEFFMRREGAEGVAFESIAVSGESSSLPHGKAQNSPLRKGFLTLDFGARFGGYCSDMTRTLSIGRATSEMKHLYKTVLSAQMEALAAIKAGASCRAVDAVARSYIERAGYGGRFGHGLGHGVGMFIHESPRLSPLAGDATLEVGHVVTVEPGIYLEGKYGCRIEDMVAITEEGYSSFTRSPKELIELFA